MGKKLLLAMGLATVIAGSKTLRSHLKAALFIPEVLYSPLRPLSAMSPEPRMREIDLGGRRALLFTPSSRISGSSPGMVLVHGANVGGIDDPRLIRVARALARLGRTVLAPSLALGERRLDPQDPRRIAEGINWTVEATGGEVVVVSFSFGSAFTLVALEDDPGIQKNVRCLVTVGTYFDLVHLLQGVTTGWVESPAGMVKWSPEQGARNLVAQYLAEALLSTEDAEAALRSLGAREPADLSGTALSLYNLMVNEDPDKTRDLISKMPPEVASLVAALSPSSRITEVTVPLLALHSTGDPASPPSESESLVLSMQERAEARLTVVGLFRHVTLQAGLGQWIRDGARLISFCALFIRAQERGLWATYR